MFYGFLCGRAMRPPFKRIEMKKILIIVLLAVPLLAKLKPEEPKVKKWQPLYSDVMQELKRREGLRLEKYICPAGVPTIGYGFTGDIPDTITVKESIQKLHEIFEEHFRTAEKEFPELKRHQHLAIAMLAYNIGWNRLKNYKLYQKFKNNEPVWNDWYQIRFYRSNGKMVESRNLKTARLYELKLWQGDDNWDN